MTSTTLTHTNSIGETATITPAPTTQPVQIAPFGVVRAGGISSQQLEPLQLELTVGLLQTAFAAQSAMERLAPAIEEALYVLVPLAGEDKELRRCILAVKRNVHNGRSWPQMTSDIATVAANLTDTGQPPTARLQLAEWQGLVVSREAALAEAATRYSQELGQASRALNRSLNNPILQQGLALASPDLLEELGRAKKNGRGEDERVGSKLVRSGLSYVTRAAMKTSPFSTFTRMGVVDFAAAGPGPAAPDNSGSLSSVSQPAKSSSSNPAPQSSSNQMRLLKALPVSWLLLMARDRELAPAFSFEPNQGLYRRADAAGEEAKLMVLITKYTLRDSFAWRSEELVERPEYSGAAGLREFLAAGQRKTYSEIIALLATTGEFADPHKTLVQLLNQQLVRPVLPFSRHEAAPLTRLAQSLAPLTGAKANYIAALMQQIQQQLESCVKASGFERLEILTLLRQKAAVMFETLGTPTPSWLKTVNLVYEDVRFENPSLVLNQQIRADLDKVAQYLRPGIVRSQLYDCLYRFFVHRYGVEGEASNILDFFNEFLSQSDTTETIGRASAEDQMAVKEANHSRSQLSGGWSAMPPAATVFFQIAAKSPEAVEQGDYKLIVNQVCQDQGGLLGRFSDLLPPEKGNLAAKLQAWLGSVPGKDPASVVRVPTVSDWSNLQSDHPTTERVLEWPGELPTSEEAADEQAQPAVNLQLGDLRLRANPTDNTLYLVDSQGCIITPTYQGVVPSHFIFHALRLFLILIDPWISDYQKVGRPLPINNNSAHLAGEEVEFTPRHEEGRVVLRRAYWRVPPALFPVRAKGETDFNFFLRVQQWRTKYNLPDEVYVTAEHKRIAFEAKLRKPIWINFNSPHSLELFRQLLDGNEAGDLVSIVLTEALPGRQEQWLSTSLEGEGAQDATLVEQGSGRHSRQKIASEFMVSLRWSMPGGVKPSPFETRQIFSTAKLPANLGRTAPANGWLYFKIYPAWSNQLDEVVRRIVAPAHALARTNPDLDRWFFIRFIDRWGWHIRLRLQGPASLHAVLRPEISNLIEQVLPTLKSPASGDQPYFVLPKLAPEVTAQPNSGYSIAHYEPEYLKYGGEVGLAIAEKLFEVSSEIALEVIVSDLQNNQLGAAPNQVGLTRTWLSLHTMHLTVRETFSQEYERHRFLDEYARYWSRPTKAEAVAWHNNYMLEMSQQHQSLLAHFGEAGLDTPPSNFVRERINALVARYGLAIRQANAAVATAGVQQVFQPTTRLSFDYIHMNNNRLGILPFEEGYLAGLLASASTSTKFLL